MKKAELNTLVTKYRQTNDLAAFNEVYRHLIEKPSGYYENVAKSTRSTPAEARATYEDTLLRCIDKYNGVDDFDRYYSRAVKLERANLYNRKKRLWSREIMEADAGYNEEFGDDLIELALNSAAHDDNSAATEYIGQTQGKTKADQRQLIDSLLENSDATTTAIVEAFPQYKSMTALGKALGLHHMQVKRALEKLASNFDSKQFGDHRDYLIAQG